MSTTFVFHEFGREHTTDGLVSWPTWGYTDWTYDLLVSRREGSSPTLDVKIEVAPVVGDESLYEDLTTFTQVTSGTALPDSQSKAGGGADFTMGADIRYHRIHQTVVGKWWYKLTGAVTLFDANKTAHKNLVDHRFRDYSHLAVLASQAEDDVIRRYTQRQPITHTTTTANVSQHRMHALDLWTTRGRLMLVADEDTGLALREAIARRLNWLMRRRELEKSSKAGDGPLLRQHLKVEWDEVETALKNHNDRVPLYAM